MNEAVSVEFPLRGEWVAGHTPAEHIPSHGTDQLGQRFAYDFLRIERERKGWKFFSASFRHYLFYGVRLDECHGWGDPIHAPFDGTVVAAKDGWPERKRLHLLTDLAVVLKNALIFDPGKNGDLRCVVGNHLILKMAGQEIYALLAHARTGSIRVGEGTQVTAGQHLADVGHSGNSTAPHLHFQLMDRADLLQAQGVPCCFRAYEAFRDGAWRAVKGGIPGMREFVRRGESVNTSAHPVENGGRRD